MVNMTELLKNAWLGWQNYIHYGKFAALFLAALMYLVMRKKRENPVWLLTIYGAVAGVLCILPPTAMCLMLYQTKFFDYEWIWSSVPVTAVTALGGTLFLTDQWKKQNHQLKNICYDMGLTALLLGIILLSGSMGQSGTADRKGALEREKAVQVLKQVDEICGKRELCIWAPKDILEYVRAENGDVQLLYGRNMWDIALNAYSYDTYPQELAPLYLWMEKLTEPEERNLEELQQEELLADGRNYIREAVSMGVNCILLPGTLSTENLSELTCVEGMEVVRVDEYYLVTLSEAEYE